MEIITRIQRILKKRIFFKYCKKNNIDISPDIQLDFQKINNLKIAPYTHIGCGASFSLFGNIYIHEGSILGPKVTILTANHNYNGSKVPYDELVIIKDVIIEKNVWIGSNVIIVPGVTIREGCVIAAGSCVTKSFPPLCIIGGNPAKIIKYRDPQKYKEASKYVYMKEKLHGNIIIKTTKQ